MPPEAALRYQLFYQLTRISRDRGALVNDDRLDALAMAVQYWVDAMAQDAEERIAIRQEERLMAEVNRIKDQASLGFAVVMGHQGHDHTRTMKW
jgi:hypothetical protein